MTGQYKEEKFGISTAAQTGINPASMVAIEQGFPSDQHMIHDGLTLKILPVRH